MFIFDKEQCIQCETCVNYCHEKALHFEGDDLVHDADKCKWCGHCLALCPRDAIQIDGDGYNVEEVEEFTLLTKATPKQIRRNIMMRRSIRTYNDTPVTDEELSLILEAAKYSPTAKNCQDNMLLVVTSDDERAAILDKLMTEIEKLGREFIEKVPGLGAFFMMKYKMYKENGEDGLFYGAPCIIFVFSDNELDGALCAATMEQMVEAQGLGSCYLQLAADPFNHNVELKKEYGIPEGKKCVIALAVGNTDEDYFCSVPRKDVPIIWK